MAGEEPVDKELDELLNSSAKQFVERPRTTDDELDELMNAADHTAAQKAASEFQAMLQQMVNFQEQQLKEAKDKEATEGADNANPSDEESANQMIEAMKNLLNCTGKVANANNEEEFEAGLNLLRSPESNMEPFMHMIMQSLVSKDVMYPPLKEIFDKYPAYLEEHKATLPAEDLARYEKQFEILGKICSEFEKQPDAPTEPETALAESNGIPAPATEPLPDNFENMAMLLMELQTHGYPPKEITGELPEGLTIDAESGIPSFGQMPTSDACSIM